MVCGRIVEGRMEYTVEGLEVGKAFHHQIRCPELNASLKAKK
jgi:hypothetical protein